MKLNDQYAIGVSTSTLHSPMISLYVNEKIPCLNMDDYNVASEGFEKDKSNSTININRPSFILERSSYYKECPLDLDDLRYRKLEAESISEQEYL